MREFEFLLDSKGHLKKRESFNLEFKKSFHYGDSIIDYLRSMVGMANNKGGQLVFGVSDKPRIPLGLLNDKFENCDPSKINNAALEYFSHDIQWDLESLDYDGKSFGIIRIAEANEKPIVCKKSYSKQLREGAIYYRYRGETKEIRYQELSEILNHEREKEKLLWIEHINQIGQIGPQNVHLLDTYKGEINVGKGKILIDKNVISKLKFVKEGHFVEKDGAPTLRLIGDISGSIETGVAIQTDKIYPLFSKDLQELLSLNSYEILCILWRLKIKGNPKYHTEIKLGKESSVINKYSESLIPIIKRMLKRKEFIISCKDEYKIEHPNLGRKTKK
jgi:hypothetical protein